MFKTMNAIQFFQWGEKKKKEVKKEFYINLVKKPSEVGLFQFDFNTIIDDNITLSNGDFEITAKSHGSMTNMQNPIIYIGNLETLFNHINPLFRNIDVIEFNFYLIIQTATGDKPKIKEEGIIVEINDKIFTPKKGLIFSIESGGTPVQYILKFRFPPHLLESNDFYKRLVVTLPLS